ncbi:MAG: acyl-CoA dehydratase activase [Candidatus Hodarchaeales archaeon]|jgi:benzoyl-CoA reductase subunit D
MVESGISLGIDCGAKNTKVIILKDGNILATASALSGFDYKDAAEKAFSEALEKASIKREEIKHFTATGAGMNSVSFANDTVTEVGADARGIISIFPSVRTVIDVGAEEGRAIRLNEHGKVIDFGINEKCAAGAGAFTEAMARALEIDINQMGKLSLKSTKSVPMNAQCTIFAESEVVSLIHQKTPKEDIVRAVHDAIADRITSMVRRVGLEQEIALIGGVANNIGFVDSMKRNLDTKILVSNEKIPPEFVTALGAALVAHDRLENEKNV